MYRDIITVIPIVLCYSFFVPVVEAQESRAEEASMVESAQGPEATTVPTSARRQLSIESNPSGATVMLGNDITAETPTEQTISIAEHRAIVSRSGHEGVTIPIPSGGTDLRLDIEMSRPVFEAGIGLVAAGSLGVVMGLVIGPMTSRGDAGMDLGLYASLISLPSLVFLVVPGIVMMVRDRNRDTTWEISEAGSS